MTTSEVCGICSTTQDEHEGRQHQFSPDGRLTPVDPRTMQSREEKAAPGVAQMTLPFDPVLRAVLIDKGLVLPSELTEAEERLRAQGFLRAGG